MIRVVVALLPQNLAESWDFVKKSKLTMPVKYVLMATLEVAPETQLSIYQEVEAKMQTQVGIEV